MGLIFLACLILFCSGLFTLFDKSNKYFVNFWGAIISSVVILYSIFMISPSESVVIIKTSIPDFYFAFQIGKLTKLFYLIVSLISPLMILFGKYYFPKSDVNKIKFASFLQNLMIASLIMLGASENALSFFMSWEFMSVSSFLLVAYEHEHKIVRKAARNYLIASQISAMSILAMFMILTKHTHLSELFQNISMLTSNEIFFVFIFALIGFGLKSGLFPFHSWLPEAHPAAPSHVSAFMSGVLIKFGVFGFLKILFILGHNFSKYYVIVAIIASISILMGIVYSLLQRNLKTVLAYSSIENIGIVYLGITLFMYGNLIGNNLISSLGLIGAFVQIASHSVLKSILFYSSGVIKHNCNTLDIEYLGALGKKLSQTSFAFGFASYGLTSLPPLGKFLAELFIFISAFLVFKYNILLSLFIICTLSFSSGLALMQFSKLFGFIFGGATRDEKFSEIVFLENYEVKIVMLSSIFLAIITPVFIIKFILSLQVIGIDVENLKFINKLNNSYMYLYFAFFVLLLLLINLRKFLFKNKKIAYTGTWDCGYIKPTNKMQYTHSSFINEITSMMRFLTLEKINIQKPVDYFPKFASIHRVVYDFISDYVIDKFSKTLDSVSIKFKKLQHGFLSIYILYILVVLVVLILWKLR